MALPEDGPEEPGPVASSSSSAKLGAEDLGASPTTGVGAAGGAPQPPWGTHPNPRKRFVVDLPTIVSRFRLPALDLSRTEELPSYDDYNFRVFCAAGERGEREERSFVVKCMHADMVSADHVRFQVALMNCLSGNGVPCPSAVPLLDSNDDKDSFVVRVDNCVAHVIDFIPNSVLYPETEPKSPKFLDYLGGIVGSVHVATHAAGFFTKGDGAHRKAGTFVWEWSTSQIPKEVSKRLELIHKNRRSDCAELLKRISEVLPVDEDVFKRLSGGDDPGTTSAPSLFRKDCYHSDLNDSNVLFSTCDLVADHYVCSGVLDFGDSGYDYVLYDVGIAAAYACMHQTHLDPLTTLLHVLQGYCARWRAYVSSASGGSPEQEPPEEKTTCWTSGLVWPREALRTVYAVSLARKLLSFIMGSEQMAGLRAQGKENTAEYVYAAHCVEPVWQAAVRHLAYPSLEEAVDRLAKQMRGR